jgi:hypothetical protein
MLPAALSGASFLCFIRAGRQPEIRTVAWWAICSSLALMTHFFAGFLVLPEALGLLWIMRSRDACAAVAAVALVQVAMLPLRPDTTRGVRPACPRAQVAPLARGSKEAQPAQTAAPTN